MKIFIAGFILWGIYLFLTDCIISYFKIQKTYNVGYWVALFGMAFVTISQGLLGLLG